MIKTDQTITPPTKLSGYGKGQSNSGPDERNEHVREAGTGAINT